MEKVVDKDQEHLRLLSIFHYVVGGVSVVFACFPIIHLIVGIFFVVSPEHLANKSGNGPPAFLGWFFILIASLFILFGLIYATCLFLSGRFLNKRKHYLFCLVVAGFNCLYIPLGTILGVFTIIVLMRPSVKKLFELQIPGTRT